jgi:hypothetical protein
MTKFVTLDSSNRFALTDLPVSSPARASITPLSTGSLAANGVYQGSIVIPKTCEIISVSANYPAWIRLYATQAAMIADALRLITTDPTPGSGIYLDASTTGSITTINCSPVPCFVNDDSPLANVGWISIINIDTISRTITFGLTYLGIES